MSIERACVNCERCYELADYAIRNCKATVGGMGTTGESDEQRESRIEAVIADPKVRKDAVYGDDQIYAARNEAMKALERVNISYNEAVSLTERKDTNDSIIAKKALLACRSCDYSAPKIVETVENLSQKK